MKTIMGVILAGVVSVAALDTPRADAAYQYRRQYYGGWSYNEINRYHHRQYFYYPTATSTTYSYHYVVYYPTQPRYYYYYNPVSRQYWGRYDLEAKGYAMLAPADRKEKLEDIKESAFPKPAAMPNIPDAEDKVAIETPPSDAPKAEK